MENIDFSENLPILKSQSGKDVIDGRLLHKVLGVGRVFRSWIKGRIDKFEFVENQDFFKVTRMGLLDNQLLASGMDTAIDYYLTLDMAKELCMIENSEIGRKARKYFIECEKKLREIVQFDVPKTMPEALRLAADLYEKNEKLIAESQKKDTLIQTQIDQIERDKPKVVYAESILESDDTISMYQLASLISNNAPIKIGEKSLFSWMRENKFLSSYPDRWNQPYQQWIKFGLFQVHESTYSTKDGVKVSFTTRITTKGQEYFVKKFVSMPTID